LAGAWSEEAQFFFDLCHDFGGDAARFGEFGAYAVLFGGGLDLLFEQGKAVALDLKPLDVVIAPAQGGEARAEEAQAFELDIGILASGRKLGQGHGQTARQADGELIGDEGARTGWLEAVGGRGAAKAGGADGEAVDGILGLPLFLPVAEAAELPVGEVDFVNRLAVEL
jgi:hypothetical protein